MAEPQDKLLGYRSDTGPVYSAYRIDYDDDRRLREILGLDDIAVLSDQYSGTVKHPNQTAIDRGYHSVKDGYQWKVLVTDRTTRDEVQQDLDDAGVSYTTENVSPTMYERKAVEACGAYTDTHMPSVISWYNDVQTMWEKAVDECEAGNLSESKLMRGLDDVNGNTIPMPQSLSRM